MHVRGIATGALLLAAATGCASVYDYRYATSRESAPDFASLTGRLTGVLEPRGFTRLDLQRDEPIPQGGDTGYASCSEPSDLLVFLREKPGRTSVHLFTCNGVPRFVVLADGWAPGEPSHTRDLLSREFAPELDRGTLILKHRYRFALE